MLRISGMTEEVLAFGRGEAGEELSDPIPQAFPGALFVFAQVRLEL